MPVPVHLDPPYATVGDDGRGVPLSVTLSSDLTEDRAAGVVSFTAPAGWLIEPASVGYDLEPGGHAVEQVVVTPPEGVADGVHWVLAQSGHGVYDLARLLVGTDVPETLEAVLGPALRLRAGDEAGLELTLRTDAATPITVQAHVISPWHTWELIATPALDLTLDGEASVEIPVRVPAGHRPGTWWVLVRLAHGGQLHYTAPVAIEVLP
jgi:hypothetical protein